MGFGACRVLMAAVYRGTHLAEYRCGGGIRLIWRGDMIEMSALIIDVADHESIRRRTEISDRQYATLRQGPAAALFGDRHRRRRYGPPVCAGACTLNCRINSARIISSDKSARTRRLGLGAAVELHCPRHRCRTRGRRGKVPPIPFR